MGCSSPCETTDLAHGWAARIFRVCIGLFSGGWDCRCPLGPRWIEGPPTGEGRNCALWTKACIPSVRSRHSRTSAANQWNGRAHCPG
eukprot:10315919-Lingulodinium_polyedra.AAC.1